MNRLLLVAVTISVLAVIAFAVFVIGSGDRRESPVVDLGDPVGDVVEPPPGAAADAGRATVLFDKWAEQLRAAGSSVEAEGVLTEDGALVIAGLDIAGPPNWLTWRWSASSARVDDADDNGFDLTSTGAQTLIFTVNGEAFHSSVNAEQIRISAQTAVGARGGKLVVAFSGVSIQTENAAPPVSVADGELRMDVTEGEGLVPLGSTAALRLNDLVLPGLAGNPLGTAIDSLSVVLAFRLPVASFALGEALEPWLTQTGGLGVRNLSLEWGTLQLSGDGFIDVDGMGRPAGLLNVRIADSLTMLDSFHAVRRLHRDRLANTYAALLLEDGMRQDDEGLPFTIGIGNGAVTLFGGSRGVDDIVLGTVSPLFTPGAVE